MRVAVMGAGVVGVTTAHELLKDGHEVVVIERHDKPAADTSWGNAGMIAPGHSFAWASPKAPMILLKSLFSRNQALRFTPSADPRLWSWSLLFLAQCTEARARRNTVRKHRLAVYSQQVLHRTLDEVALDFDRRDGGILLSYRSPQSLERGIAHMEILAELGQEIRVLDRAGAVAAEPALESAAEVISGAILCPTDETGDCHRFTAALAADCAGRGAEFRFDTTIERIDVDGDRVTGLSTSAGRIAADAYVLALGCQSPMLARPLGIRLPIYPIKGYSLTAPVGNHRSPPGIGVIDEDNLVAISRFGDRVRVTATAEFAGYDTSHRPSDFDHMLNVASGLFPDGADYERAERWAGLRPMTPEGTPYFGPTRYRNLHLNTGHGHIGWTMSHGSARIAADLIAGREPAIPVDGTAPS